MLQNTDDVRLDFLVWGFTWPLWLLTLVSAVVGAFVWFGLGVLRRHNRRKERRQDRRDLTARSVRIRLVRQGRVGQCGALASNRRARSSGR